MSSTAPVRILLVCTGNICRSPMAEALFRAVLTERGLAAHVLSAGLTEGAQPVDPFALQAVAAYGGDLEAHRSRRLDGSVLRTAELVLGMAREHVREVVALDPGAWPRAFTLKEFVRRGAVLGPRPVGLSVAQWLHRLHQGRQASDLLGRSIDDDVDDPLGHKREVFERTAAELADLVRTAIGLLFPGTSGVPEQESVR